MAENNKRKRLGELMYTGKYEDKVYAVCMRNVASTRISIEVYIEDADGRMSDLITIPKSDIITRKNWEKVFCGLEADFDNEDIAKIKKNITSFADTDKFTDSGNKETLEDMYRALVNYITENSPCYYKCGDTKKLGIFTKGNYGYIDSHMLDEFIKENDTLGYKKLEIKMRLKIMGVLEVSNNRPYDFLVSIGGKRRFHKILLEKFKDEEASESFTGDSKEEKEEDEKGNTSKQNSTQTMEEKEAA